MAKAERSVLLEGLSGKAGNVVFSKGKEGTQVKPHVKGHNPNTPAQQLIRENLSYASGSTGPSTPPSSKSGRTTPSTRPSAIRSMAPSTSRPPSTPS